MLLLAGRRHTLDLAASALAGLASTEDFTKVRLRKTAGPEENLKDEYRGTKPIMLIHIKGKSNTFECIFRKAQLHVSQRNFFKVSSVYCVQVVVTFKFALLNQAWSP